ncbi:MAG: beta-galactosidase [Phycisphaerales bacterium]|nr:beta-galactosidase [Phycisphaerales bacterium]
MPKYQLVAVLFVGILLTLTNLLRANLVIKVKPTTTYGLFTPDQPVDVHVEVINDQSTPWQGSIQIDCFDLLSEQTITQHIAIVVPGSNTATYHYKPQLPNGVYRLDTALVGDASDPLVNTAKKVRTFIAYAPGVMARELPDDWPIGMHISTNWAADRPLIMLPGFKWCRVFNNWSQANPALGKYDWSRLDPVVAAVKDAGGRVVIANDHTPAWTVTSDNPHVITRSVDAVGDPPDDMGNFRTYIRALLERYDADGSGIIGALENWNEANAWPHWATAFKELTEAAKVMKEEADRSPSHPKVIGISLSAGQHAGYVNGSVQAGQLQYVDIVSGHWYGEMHTYSTDHLSIYTHWLILHKPMVDAGYDLPIWNTESGIKSVERENGRLVPQDELNRRARADEEFNPAEPWKIGKSWRAVSEQRAASEYVAGIVRLMSLGVSKTFIWHYGMYRDGSTSLQWVTTSVLGEALRRVDYHKIAAVEAKPVNAPEDIKAMAFRLGGEDEPRFTLVWAYQSNEKVGVWKAWMPWLTPQQVQVSVNSPSVVVKDLYGRTSQTITAENGHVTIAVGEEPVYLWERE